MPAEYDGAASRKSLGCFATRREAAEALGRAIYAQQEAATAKITLTDLYQQFADSHYYASLSKSAQTSHRSAWGHLTAVADTPVVDINKSTFQHPVDLLHQQGLKRETLAKVRNLASLLCKEGMGLGLLTVNYGQLVQLPRADTEPPTPFTSAELKTLWAAADNGNTDAMAVLVLCYTGMRPGELLTTKIEEGLHIDTPDWYIYGGSKTDAGRDRIIPLPTVIRPIITSLVANRIAGPLIASPTGKHYRLDNWRPKCFNTLMDALHLVGHVPYSCRHTYADLQKRRKVEPEIMMEIMGHEDYSTTVEHYHTTTDEDISRICAAADGLTRPT